MYCLFIMFRFLEGITSYVALYLLCLANLNIHIITNLLEIYSYSLVPGINADIHPAGMYGEVLLRS